MYDQYCMGWRIRLDINNIGGPLEEETFLMHMCTILYCLKSLYGSFYKPSIYLSADSHCVFPVDIKYRICVYRRSISILTCSTKILNKSLQHTRSVTALFRSNSCLASCLISRLVFSSAMRLVLRRICRQRESALPLCRNYFPYNRW